MINRLWRRENENSKGKNGVSLSLFSEKFGKENVYLLLFNVGSRSEWEMNSKFMQLSSIASVRVVNYCSTNLFNQLQYVNEQKIMCHSNILIITNL